jgi:hypothetical protein
MYRGLLLTALSGAILAGTACSLAMRPVPFHGSEADWQQLAGDWLGEYQIAEHDRYGVIEFRLKANEHAASGDVLMIVDDPRWPDTGMPQDGRKGQPAPDSRLLSIRFVEADRGGIHGTMEPYWDPQRGCRASASFLGSVDGDVISGSLTSACEGGLGALRGHWRVERRRERPPASRERQLDRSSVTPVK